MWKTGYAFGHECVHYNIFRTWDLSHAFWMFSGGGTQKIMLYNIGNSAITCKGSHTPRPWLTCDSFVVSIETGYPLRENMGIVTWGEPNI